MATHNRQAGDWEGAHRCGARDGADEEPGPVHEEACGDACHHHVPARRVPRLDIRMLALGLLQLESIGFGALCTHLGGQWYARLESMLNPLSLAK